MTSKKTGAVRRGVCEDEKIRQICPVCGRVCLENAIDKFGEIVGCEKCVNFESACRETTMDKTGYERVIL